MQRWLKHLSRGKKKEKRKRNHNVSLVAASPTRHPGPLTILCGAVHVEKKKKRRRQHREVKTSHKHTRTGRKTQDLSIFLFFFFLCVCVSWAAVRVSGIPLLRRHLWQRVRPLGSVSASHRAAKMTEARGREITCGGFNARVNPLGLTRGTRATLDASILHDDSTFFYCFQGPTDCLMLFTASHSERLAERPPPLFCQLDLRALRSSLSPSLSLCVCVCVCVCTYIFIYIYMRVNPLGIHAEVRPLTDEICRKKKKKKKKRQKRKHIEFVSSWLMLESYFTLHCQCVCLCMWGLQVP